MGWQLKSGFTMQGRPQRQVWVQTWVLPVPCSQSEICYTLSLRVSLQRTSQCAKSALAAVFSHSFSRSQFHLWQFWKSPDDLKCDSSEEGQELRVGREGRDTQDDQGMLRTEAGMSNGCSEQMVGEQLILIRKWHFKVRIIYYYMNSDVIKQVFKVLIITVKETRLQYTSMKN